MLWNNIQMDCFDLVVPHRSSVIAEKGVSYASTVKKKQKITIAFRPTDEINSSEFTTLYIKKKNLNPH